MSNEIIAIDQQLIIINEKSCSIFSLYGKSPCFCSSNLFYAKLHTNADFSINCDNGKIYWMWTVKLLIKSKSLFWKKLHWKQFNKAEPDFQPISINSKEFPLISNNLNQLHEKNTGFFFSLMKKDETTDKTLQKQYQWNVNNFYFVINKHLKILSNKQ